MQEVTLCKIKKLICLVGSDRTTIVGDVCNKIGTYLKACAMTENNVPFSLPYQPLPLIKK